MTTRLATLVLLPGMDGTGDLLADFAAALGPEIEVIVASYPKDKALGYAELEAIARTFLPKDNPFYLLGESFSGPIAISIAASQPPGLLGLILCCSFARNPLPLLAPARPLLPLCPVSAIPVSLLGCFVLGRFATPPLRSALGAALASISAHVVRERAGAALSVDVSVFLAGVRAPVLYLRASEDRVVPESSSALIASILPNTRVVEIEAPHFLLQVRPTEAAAAVADFMGLQQSLCEAFAHHPIHCQESHAPHIS